MYNGEANIYHENIETFLHKGLKSSEETQKQHTNITKITVPNENNFDTNQYEVLCNTSKDEGYIGTDATVALPKEEFSGEMTELDNKIRTLMVRGESMIKRRNGMIRVFVCQVC